MQRPSGLVRRTPTLAGRAGGRAAAGAGAVSAAAARSARSGSGHRLLPHTADCLIEAWGPDRPACVAEALAAMVDAFVEVPDASATKVLPVAAPQGASDADALVSLLEDVLYVVDVLGVVPVRVHLAETEDGGLAGDLEVVPLARARVVGPVPKGVSYHGLEMGRDEGGWRCRVLLDV